MNFIFTQMAVLYHTVKCYHINSLRAACFFYSGLRQPDIIWSKVDGELPYGHSVVDGILRINRVSEEDAGIYNCTAVGEYSRTHDVVHLFILG
jgi:hypothetical protein